MTEALHHIIYTARRFKTSTALNITGLVAAFSVCYLLLTQVAFQTGYNHGIKDHKRIYRLESNTFHHDSWGSSVCRFMADELAAMPEVEGMTMTLYGWKPNAALFKLGSKDIELPLMPCNNTAVSNLTDQVVDGSIEWTDTDREGLIIPASIAKQYFGTTHAAGKSMLYISEDSSKQVTVRGVYQDFPENSTPRNYIMYNVKDRFTDRPGNMCYTCLVKFKDGVGDVNSLIGPLKQRFKAKVQRMLSGKNDEELKEWLENIDNFNYQFRPLDEVYFSDIDVNDEGNRNALGIIELIVLLIIIVATINNLNYTLAISPMWVRDTNTRMVMGATRSSIRKRLVAETVIITVTACLLALVLCQVLSIILTPNELFDGNIALSAHPGIIIAVLAIAAAIGIISGTYPAYFVTSIQMATALKSSFGLTPRGIKLRTALIGLQLIITMFLVSFICTLYQQTQFIFNSDYGYDIDRIINVDLNVQNPDYREDLSADLKQLPEVENVAYSLFNIGSSDVYMSYFHNSNVKDTTKTIHYYMFPVGDNYFSTMGIQMVEGREFKPTDKLEECLIVNEAMNELISNGELPRNIIKEDIEMDVVGVCKNIRYGTTRIDKNTPIGFVHDHTKELCWGLNVRLAKGADRNDVKAEIAQLIKKHSGHESAQILDMDMTLNESYKNEFRFVKLVLLFSIACIIIMLVGVFCMTMLETEYRRKEIGIRKVAGASSGDIIGMLCKRYCGLILVCFVFATPIAYYLGNLWLNSFAEHQSISWWQFPFSLLVVGGLTLGTILLQCWHVAHENPVNSIKDE